MHYATLIKVIVCYGDKMFLIKPPHCRVCLRTCCLYLWLGTLCLNYTWHFSTLSMHLSTSGSIWVRHFFCNQSSEKYFSIFFKQILLSIFHITIEIVYRLKMHFDMIRNDKHYIKLYISLLKRHSVCEMSAHTCISWE